MEFDVHNQKQPERKPDMDFATFIDTMRVSVIAMAMARTRPTGDGQVKLNDIMRKSAERDGVYLDELEEFLNIDKKKG